MEKCWKVDMKHSREADRASEPEGFSGWERTRKKRIISGLGRQNSEKKGN